MRLKYTKNLPLPQVIVMFHKRWMGLQSKQDLILVGCHQEASLLNADAY